MSATPLWLSHSVTVHSRDAAQKMIHVAALHRGITTSISPPPFFPPRHPDLLRTPFPQVAALRAACPSSRASVRRSHRSLSLPPSWRCSRATTPRHASTAAGRVAFTSSSTAPGRSPSTPPSPKPTSLPSTRYAPTSPQFSTTARRRQKQMQPRLLPPVMLAYRARGLRAS